MRTEPEGLLLLGGRSTRFGSNKMRVSLEGDALYHAAYRALAALCKRVHLSVADADSRLPSPPDVAGCSWDAIPDPVTGQGPLGGILAASCERDLLVLAGDLPAVRYDDLRRILASSESSDAGLVLARARTSGRGQPLCGLWRASLRPELQAYVDGGGRSVFGFLDRATVQWVDVDDAHLVNINRPEDLDLLTGMS